MLNVIDGPTIKRAVCHRSNYEPIIFCTISLMAVGLLMTIMGIITILIDHIEMGPPGYDIQYERYTNSSLAGIIGPMFVIFGGSIILGNLVVLGYASRVYYSHKQEAIACSGRIMKNT